MDGNNDDLYDLYLDLPTMERNSPGMDLATDQQIFSLYLTPPISPEIIVPASAVFYPPVDPDITIPVSTVFYPGSHEIGYNLVFNSSDSVLFYVHTDILTEKSKNAFRPFLLQLFAQSGSNDSSIVPIQESALVLDVMLHIIYNEDYSPRKPTFSNVILAIDHMPIYNIDPGDYVTPGNINYTSLLSFAPLHPLELYALAGHHDLLPLATAVSAHLLSYPLSEIDDDSAVRMGPVFLKRLFRLHMDRLQALKEILLLPPHPHPPTRECGFGEQKKAMRAWAMGVAQLAWEASPDISTARIKASFTTFDDQFSCPGCREMVSERLNDIVTRWACANHTIGL